MLEVTTNAEEVASGLLGVVEAATAEADEEAARKALDLVDRNTPRKTGRLASGLRAVVVAEGGFEVVDAVPYAPAVDARTGFASRTIAEADDTLAAIYDKHLQARLDQA